MAHSLLFSKAARTAMMELAVLVLLLLVSCRSSNVAIIRVGIGCCVFVSGVGGCS